MRIALGLLALILIATVALSLYVRLAPSDPAVWNVPVASPAPAVPGPCAAQVTVVPKGARATCLLPGAPADVLARLDAMALAAPRTTRLAGSAAEGHITWISRSRLMGYPDYITAEAVAAPDGTRLDILSRQRFGESDFGVNAARLRLWLGSL